MNIWYLIINYVVILSCSIILSIQDIRRYNYSNLILILASWLIVVSHLFFNFSESYLYAFRAVIGFCFYYCIRKMSKGKLGWGDIFFGAFIGICVPNIFYFIISIFIELIAAGLLLFILDKKNKKITLLPGKLPFIPFMSIGFVISYTVYFILQLVLLFKVA